MVTITEALGSITGKRFEEKKLREILQIGDYEEYYRLIGELQQEGRIEPVKSSGSNGMNPPLYKRYRVINREESYDALIPEIRLLHSALNIEGYLNQPERYQEHREWIVPLDSWLKRNFAQLDTTVSINERSFQIFCREKALKYDRELAAVLSFNPGVRELLNYYDTPEPFFTYHVLPYDKVECNKAEYINVQPDPADSVNPGPVHPGEGPVNVLISENKDTWYTLRKLMNPSQYEMFGIPFHILLYGEGKKINRKNSTLTDFDKFTLSGYKSRYYYFGDIDYEGISIFTELKQQNPALDIVLMTPLYRMMLDKSKAITLPITKDKQEAGDMEDFLFYFEPEEKAMVLELLHARRYIPQEILNYGDFLRIINHTIQSD